MLKKLAVILCLFSTAMLSSNSVLAQTKKEKKEAKKLIKEADEYYASGLIVLALPLYKEADALVPGNAVVDYRIGNCMLHTGQKENALPYLEKAYTLDPEVDEKILLYLAEGYHYVERFDEAIDYYNKYIDQSDNEVLVSDAQYRIKQCEYAKELVKNPIEIELVNLGPNVNSEYKEYSPVVSADESVLVFTARKPDSKGGEVDEYGEFMEDIYISKKVDGAWSQPVNMKEINTDGHEAGVGLSPDGKKLIIFIGDTKGGGDIYYCKQNDDGTWVKPKSFSKEISQKNSYEPSAVISNDGNTLFFVSDRSGGYGGLDIYAAKKDKKGEWGDPENLGSTINTPYDEDAPFLDIDGKTLYFSSDGHLGMGDADIFKSKYDSTTSSWSTPHNMGYPINSTREDLYFWLSGDGRKAYFSSSKEDGYGQQDMYMIILPKPEDYEERVKVVEAIVGHEIEKEEEPEPEPEPVPVPVPVPEPVGTEVTATIKVMETGTEALIDGAVIEIIDKNNPSEKISAITSQGIFRTTFNNEKDITYDMYVEKEGYIYHSSSLFVPGIYDDEPNVEKLVFLKKPEVATVTIIRNIYFDFDKSTLKPESYTELNKLEEMLKTNPTMKVEIAGHTDSKGSDSYNETLSQKRAQSVVKYLVGKGIDNNRLTAKGYGESKPIASNDDEDEGRELNRRTEFIIMEK